jgi:hypothetical protein
MKSKKGVDLTMNTVIIAALAVIVLIVLVFMFIQGSRDGSTVLFGCESRQGTCDYSTAEECRNAGGRVDPVGRCPEDMVCCLFTESDEEEA